MLSSMLNNSMTLASVPPLNLATDLAQNQGTFWERVFFRGGAFQDYVRGVDALYMLIFWFGVFWFVLLMALMVYWVIKYRRRPGVPQQRSPSHNTLLELIWTIVPSSSLLVLFLLGFWTYMDSQVAPKQALELNISGYKWGWDITYPNGAASPLALPISPGNTTNGGAGVPVILLPEDTDIKLTMEASDVIHSFWIPDFRIKMDLYPNRKTGYTFKTPTVATGEQYQDHWIFCAEYCGDLHSEMAAILRVVPQAQYVSWVGSINLDGMDPVTVGLQVATGKCFTCHSIDGSANIGPTWKDLYGYEFQYSDGSTLTVDENHIRESIIYPEAKKQTAYAGAVMTAFPNLSDLEMNGLIAYIKSLSDRAPEDPFAGEGEAEGEDGEAPAEAGEESAEAPANESETEVAAGR